MIRKKYFIPFIIILVLLVIFRFFFLDNLIKYGIERSFSSIPKLSVQIENLKLRILKGDMTIKGMVFIWKDSEYATLTDKVVLDINTPQLLRGKFVVSDMEVLGMHVVSKNLVYWEETPKKESKAKKATLKLAGSALSYYSADSLGERLEINQMLDVSKANFTNILNKELSEVRVSYDELQKAFASSDLDKSLKDLESSIKELEKKKPTDLMKIPKYIQEISSLNKEYDKVKKAYEKKQNAFKQFQSRVELAGKKVEEAGNLDMKMINDKLKFVDTKKQSLTSDLVGPEVIKYSGYANKGIEILKVLKDGKNKHKRKQFKGVDIAFPIKDSYPVFYINKLRIEGTDKRGNIFKGRGSDITYKQTIRNLPTRLELFQNVGTESSFVGITVDLREGVTLLADGFRKNRDLNENYWDTKQVPLQITDGKYDINFKGGYMKNKILADIRLKTNGLKIKLAPSVSEKSFIENFLFESLSKIPYFSLDINLDGDKLSIDSNVDEEMMSATQSLINREIEKVKQNYANQWQSFVKEQEESFKKELSKLVTF